MTSAPFHQLGQGAFPSAEHPHRSLSYSSALGAVPFNKGDR